MRKRNPALRPEEALTAWEAARPVAASALVRVRCKLVTPMYGGGVEPGKVDCAMPVRPTAIRGQLRFWWRLLYGARRGPQDVFAEECALWGGISKAGPQASKVSVGVASEPVESGQMIDAESANVPDYTLVRQGSKVVRNPDNNPPGSSRSPEPDSIRRHKGQHAHLERGDNPLILNAGYTFTVELRFANKIAADEREQVIEALRWWGSFGGVGARTRRGFGALEVASGDVALSPVSPVDVEARGGLMILRSPCSGGTDAWRSAVQALRDFRQAPNVGRSPGQRQHHVGRNPGQRKHPGRSRWPEPDSIRRHTGQHAPGHQPQHPVVGQYPRAAFGLPIVFQFKDKDRGDPRDPKNKSLTLHPASEDHDSRKKQPSDRMASPLILRPYFDGAQYRPLALLLPGWEERVSVPVALGSTDLGPAWPEDPGEREQLASLVSPMKDRGTDALTAFLHYFEHPTPNDRGRERGRR